MCRHPNFNSRHAWIQYSSVALGDVATVSGVHGAACTQACTLRDIKVYSDQQCSSRSIKWPPSSMKGAIICIYQGVFLPVVVRRGKLMRVDHHGALGSWEGSRHVYKRST